MSDNTWEMPCHTQVLAVLLDAVEQSCVAPVPWLIPCFHHQLCQFSLRCQLCSTCSYSVVHGSLGVSTQSAPGFRGTKQVQLPGQVHEAGADAREPFLLLMTMDQSAGVVRDVGGVCCHRKDGLLRVGWAELQPTQGLFGSDWAPSTELMRAEAEQSLLG